MQKYELEQYKLAIDDYSKAIELNPQLMRAYHNRGYAKFKLAQYESAIEDYNKILELNPQDEDALYKKRNFKIQISST